MDVDVDMVRSRSRYMLCVCIYIYAYTYIQLLYLAALTWPSAARSLVSAVLTLDTTRDVLYIFKCICIRIRI